MSNTRIRNILAFSALVVLSAGQARASLALPEGPSLPPAPGTVDETGANRQPMAPPAAGPESRPASDEPAKEEKSDCDDCVIVDREGGEARSDGLLAGVGAGTGNLLAGTLWGLFAVSRPRRTPRAIIRGVTVP